MAEGRGVVGANSDRSVGGLGTHLHLASEVRAVFLGTLTFNLWHLRLTLGSKYQN